MGASKTREGSEVRWPWVARSTLDAVTAERDRLLVQVDKLMDHHVRMERNEHGLSETPRVAKERDQGMPRSLHEKIEQFASKPLQKMQRDSAYARRNKGDSWANIEATMFPPEEAASNEASTE